MSYRPKVNYALRPAKTIERKMIAEAVGRLRPFGRLESFRYVGFGSLYFKDFLLIHRALGVEAMTSLELPEHVESAARFDFNKPYSAITIDFASPVEYFGRITDWSVPTIAWFDYESKISSSVLADVASFAFKAESGSALIVTLNVHVGAAATLNKQDLIGPMREDLGPVRIPPEWDSTKLAGDGLAEVTHSLILSEVGQVLIDRNGGKSGGDRMVFEQFLHFRYRDGMRMFTIGIVFLRELQRNVFLSCGLGDLPFVRRGEEPFTIEVPNLTFREIRHLDSFLPGTDTATALDAPASILSIPVEDARMYGALYRYFPSFAEADL